jgi:hypothetical protein
VAGAHRAGGRGRRVARQVDTAGASARHPQGPVTASVIVGVGVLVGVSVIVGVGVLVGVGSGGRLVGQLGKLKAPMRVRQLKLLVVA